MNFSNIKIRNYRRIGWINLNNHQFKNNPDCLRENSLKIKIYMMIIIQLLFIFVNLIIKCCSDYWNDWLLSPIFCLFLCIQTRVKNLFSWYCPISKYDTSKSLIIRHLSIKHIFFIRSFLRDYQSNMSEILIKCKEYNFIRILLIHIELIKW